MKNKEYPLYQLKQIQDLKELLWQKMRDMPNRVAFSFLDRKGHTLEKTYSDIYRESNALGTWEYLNMFRGVHIGIVGENSYEWLLSFFSIVNGGNVAVPVDKDLPEKEIVHLLQKADAQAVFISSSCKNLKEMLQSTTRILPIMMNEIPEYIMKGQLEIEKGNREYVDFILEREKTCCILFTSGTAGQSKGVMLSHRNFATDINESCKLFELTGNTVALLPFHHAFGLVVAVLMVVHYGYTVYINKSLRTVMQSLQKAKPQTMMLVPLYVETFHRQIWKSAKREKRVKVLKLLMAISDSLFRLGIDVRKTWFSSVREAFGGNLEYIICGGAGIDRMYIREFRSWGIEVLNGYGTTECSPCVAVNRNYFHKDETVGLPVPGSLVKIADDGEVMVWGGHVMHGYYGEPEETAAVLQDGWYKTGDLGYLDEEGFLTLTGRKKNLIILSNGENVSPEELEQDFLRDEAVREALVYVDGGIITVEIYPDEEFCTEKKMDDDARTVYFQTLLRRINDKRPFYKHVGKIKFRNTEFEKNTNKKIIRQGGAANA